ncbi:MAG: hypothetical protein GC182_07155 [Rhodopseudomonas sp.]|nr:hypothetical protein [Rhodopseudomonas sp.]
MTFAKRRRVDVTPPLQIASLRVISMARYVIFTESLFTKRDWDRFGCADFVAAGYDVVCIEIGHLFGSKSGTLGRGDFTSIPEAVVPADLAALDAFLRLIADADLVFMQVSLSQRTRGFFRMLKVRNVQYCVATMGPIPTSRMRSFKSALSLSNYLKLRTEDFRSIFYWLGKLGRQILSEGTDYFRLQPPKVWLTSGTRSLSHYLHWPQLWRARPVPVASYDYKIARSCQRQGSPAGRTAVFLDEAYADHPDYDILDQKSPVDGNRYWTSLEKLFQAVEKETGLTVIIAPHPKSSGVPAQIEPRRWIKDHSSAELVRDSELALCHSSTAVSFAVYFRKPVIFLTTDQIEGSIPGALVVRMSSYFGARRVNADRFVSSELRIPEVDEGVYARYQNSYLKPRDATDASPWEVMRKEMKK